MRDRDSVIWTSSCLTIGGWRRNVLTALMNLSDRGHLDPKLLVWSVMFSLVWESKDGFSISAFTNTQMWFFTWWNRVRTQFLKQACRENCFGQYVAMVTLPGRV